MIEIYGIKNCDSVKKALAFFKNNNLPYNFHDFKIEPASCQKIDIWLKSTDIKKLFNARSTTYRKLQLKDKELHERDMAAWLCKENLLIKRPIIEYNGEIVVGFNESDYQGVFL